METPTPSLEVKPQITVNTKNLPALKEYSLNDVCNLTMKGKVVGVRQEGDRIVYTLDVEKYGVKAEKTVEEKLHERSMDPVTRKIHKDLEVVDVRTQTSPSVS